MRSTTITLMTLVLFIWSASARALVPGTLSYQAYLTQADGSALDGNVVVSFALYATDIGGSPLWSDAQVIEVDRGLMSVALGNPANPFPPGLFSTPLWIGISVDGDAELLPRRALTSAPFAFEADNALSLQGLGPAAFDQSAHTSDLANPHQVSAAQIDAASNNDIVALQTQLDAAQANIGALQNDLTNANALIATLQSDLVGQIAALAAEMAARVAGDEAHDTAIAAIEANSVLELDGVLTRPDSATALLTGVNLQIVNGTGLTASAGGGTGNVIIGYNTNNTKAAICSLGVHNNEVDCLSANGVWAASHKTGSHNLIVGDRNNYSNHSGIVAGTSNSITGRASSILGGINNHARGQDSSIVGGASNTASGTISSVFGGQANQATGGTSTISGGSANKSPGAFASVSGGRENMATGLGASISGGINNTASGSDASVSGGRFNLAFGEAASVTGGGGAAATDGNTARGDFSSIGGGTANTINALALAGTISGGQNGELIAGANYASIGGGLDNVAVGRNTHVSGGRNNKAWGNFSSIAGGNSNTAGDDTLTTDDAVNRYNVIVGGQLNVTKAQYSVVVGGGFNTTTGFRSVVLGGSSNTMAATDGSLGGGTNETYTNGGPFIPNCGGRFCAEGVFLDPD